MIRCAFLTIAMLLFGCPHGREAREPEVPTLEPVHVASLPLEDRHGMALVHGRVVSSDLTEALEGATVVAADAGHHQPVITDASGTYELLVSPGTVHFMFVYADLIVEWRVVLAADTSVEMPDTPMKSDADDQCAECLSGH